MQIALFYAYPKSEIVPVLGPLKLIPQTIGDWRMVEESELDSEVQALLKADDTVNRIYAKPGEPRLPSLYVAYFKTQRTGISPHSPKVCLPGSGWVPSESDRLEIPVPGRTDPITVNRYVVAKGEYRSLVLYWYHTAHRTIADEYAAKVYTVLDSVRYRRSDTSLVRIVVPYLSESDTKAEPLAIAFIQNVYPALSAHLPH